ncbi:hypothetical protein NJ76_30785 [Rhodococcus sp. IITR03]|nr:hypothetical protein NJ76_30785 [Rhodococcus sp. IITR03]
MPISSGLRLAKYRRMNFLTRELFSVFSWVPPAPVVRALGQFRSDAPVAVATISRPASPRETASTSARRCSWLWGSIPCTDAMARVSSADASKKKAVSAPTAPMAASVPMPGKAAVARAADPLPVTVSRNCFSSRSMICAGDSSGCERRMRSTYLATAGPCSLAPLSSILTIKASATPALLLIVPLFSGALVFRTALTTLVP